MSYEIEITPEIGGRIREAREFLGISRADAAEFLRARSTSRRLCSAVRLSLIERGDVRLTAEELEALSGIYGCVSDDFFQDRPWQDVTLSPEAEGILARVPELEAETIRRFVYLLRRLDKPATPTDAQ